jgi:hypothetical protein
MTSGGLNILARKSYTQEELDQARWAVKKQLESRFPEVR